MTVRYGVMMVLLLECAVGNKFIAQKVAELLQSSDEKHTTEASAQSQEKEAKILVMVRNHHY